jgi:hypothetical protein
LQRSLKKYCGLIWFWSIAQNERKNLQWNQRKPNG